MKVMVAGFGVRFLALFDEVRELVFVSSFFEVHDGLFQWFTTQLVVQGKSWTKRGRGWVKREILSNQILKNYLRIRSGNSFVCAPHFFIGHYKVACIMPGLTTILWMSDGQFH